MHHQEHAIAEYNPGPLRKQYTLFLGVWSQFCYVGAQVAVAGYFMYDFPWSRNYHTHHLCPSFHEPLLIVVAKQQFRHRNRPLSRCCL